MNWYDWLIKQTMAREKIIRDKLNNKISINTWTLFETEEKKEHRKKNHNKRIIKDKIIRDTRTLFEQEDYYECTRVSNF